MSNDKKVLQAVGKNIIIRSLGEIKEISKLIAMPDGMKDTYSSRRQWEDGVNIIYSIGDEVTKVKIGDKVFLDAHVKLRRIEKMTELIESKTGVNLTVDVKNKEGKLVNKEETEKYFCVSEDDVLCVVLQ